MELPSVKMQSYSLNNSNSISTDLLPYRCPACGNGKRFRSLIALRLHTSIVHDIKQPNNRLTSTKKHSSNENLSAVEKSSSLDVFVPSSPSNNEQDLSVNFSNLLPSTAIDDMFNKYSERIDDVANKFDSQSKKLESKLKLTKQLEEIRKQKEQLNKLKKAWKAAHGVSQLVHDTDVVINKHISNDIANFESEKSKRKRIENQVEKKIYKDQSKEIHVPNMEKQLNISIQLAAEYKALALDAEKKLKEKIEEERHLKDFIEATAVKEQEAKAKLADFMESLLQRTEYAESMLQAYHNKREPFNDNRHLESIQINRSKPLFHPKQTKRQSDFQAKVLMTPHRDASSHLGDSGISLLPDSHLSNQYNNYRFLDSRNKEISEKKTRKRYNRTKNKTSFSFAPFSNMNDDGEDSNRAADRRVALFCVFTRLRSIDLLRCALVCREWRDTSRHSQLWSRIRLHDVNIDPKLLQLIAAWSRDTCSLCIKNIGLLPPEKVTGAGVFEEGLEMILKSCAEKLLVISIDRCDPFVTSRALWLVSCHNKNICSVSYRSSLDPVSHQVAWALGSSCRNLVSLEVAPLQPCSARGLFTNNVARLLSWCWPQLQALSFGGHDIDGTGLLAVALNCHHLKVLELDHARGVSHDHAVTVCKHGLQELHTLLFTHTPVLPSTLLHFLKALKLKSVYVIVAQRDYLTRSKYKKISGEYRKISRALVNIAQSQPYRGLLSVECQ